MSNENVRILFDFTKEAVENLDELQKMMNAETRAEVVRLGLGILHSIALDASPESIKAVMEDARNRLHKNRGACNDYETNRTGA